MPHLIELSKKVFNNSCIYPSEKVNAKDKARIKKSFGPLFEVNKESRHNVAVAHGDDDSNWGLTVKVGRCHGNESELILGIGYLLEKRK